ncbi:hypothetical protein [Compostibacter hankyongensis]|uniref:Glycoside hydrolase family 5 domain-containing protein n=1 Tax=Compostibacter hankyongensis TaxID=1007089 RepID=A0ABP8G5L7_9BACT
MIRILIKKAATVLLLLTFCTALQAQSSRYIFVNTAPGRSWSVAHPSTFNRQIIDEIIEGVGTRGNAELRVGISFVFDFLRADLDSVAASLDRFMALSRQTGIPILINLDGVNWWGARPDLWNWWDPSAPGYNPANRRNVEWSGWSDSLAVKICWRNWGAQLRVLPAPNLSSPAVLAAHIAALQQLIPRIVKWYNQLPADRKYLLGGVKLGHETSIGVNAYYYKKGNRYLEQRPHDPGLDPLESFQAGAGLSGGLAQLGYAAVSTAGIAHQGRITREDIARVVYHYLDTVCQTACHLGLPRELIYTHQGDTYAPWHEHLSFAAAANAWSRPGWSFYSVDPATAGDLGDVLDRREHPGWAAVEWWWPGETEPEWSSHLLQTLTYKDCRFLDIYNWENMLEKSADGRAAIRRVAGMLQKRYAR